MSSPETGLVATTGQASLVLLSAHPDLMIQGPAANATSSARSSVAAAMPNGVLGWEADSEQFHLFTDSGTFALRRNEIVWPDGTTLRGEDVGTLVDAQLCAEFVSATTLAAVGSLDGQGRGFVVGTGYNVGSEPSGWTEVGFADSGWPLIALQTSSVYAGPIAGTQWVTTTPGDLGTELTWLHRRSFDLPQAIDLAVRLQFGVDNQSIGVWLNGVQVDGPGPDAGHVGFAFRTISIDPSLLRLGATNVLAIEVWNDDTVGPTSLDYLLEVDGVEVRSFLPDVPSTSFAALSGAPRALLRESVPQNLGAAPPGAVAVLRVVHGDGTSVAEGDGEQLHLRTTEGWFSFRGNCITFPHGQMLCGQELCPSFVPLQWTYSLSGARTQTSWNDTGIDLPAGADVLFVATGSVCGFEGGGCHGPDGNGLVAPAGFTGHGFYLVPGLLRYSLIGRIGASGAPFQVGSGATLSTGVGGHVYLSVNDDNFPDNSGDWEVVITLLEGA